MRQLSSVPGRRCPRSAPAARSRRAADGLIGRVARGQLGGDVGRRDLASGDQVVSTPSFSRLDCDAGEGVVRAPAGARTGAGASRSDMRPVRHAERPRSRGSRTSGMLTTRISLSGTEAWRARRTPRGHDAGPCRPGRSLPLSAPPEGSLRATAGVTAGTLPAPAGGVTGPRRASVGTSAPGPHGLELLDGHEDRPGLGALRRADDTLALEQVHEPPGPGEARPAACAGACDVEPRPLRTTSSIASPRRSSSSSSSAAARPPPPGRSSSATPSTYAGSVDLALPVGRDLADALLVDPRALDPLRPGSTTR